MAFIEMQGLSHSYSLGQEKEILVLDHIDLKIQQGEFVAILGANGSGKSTLAKHINGLLLPTAGICRIDGMSTMDAECIWKIRQQVGMVFQNPDNQIVAAVVEDDVAFGPENLGMEPERIRNRVRDSLEMVGMAEFRSYAPYLLSGGQKQRVAIAGALAMRTKCLVLDEPTAMLDPKGREDVLKTVLRLHREEGLTIVYITHFPEEAMEAERVLVMGEGKIVADGTPLEVFSKDRMVKKQGLALPLAFEIASGLRRAGLELPNDIGTEEKLIEHLAAKWRA